MRSAAILAAAVALLATPGALAKEFDPGDLRLCNARRCVLVTNPATLTTLARFYYREGRPPREPAVALGAPYFQLRFRNGYVTGIVATTRLDRFLSYGVHLERFARDVWYRVPETAAAELRRLAAPLTPLRVTRVALARSR
jgi:hypothetical protein